MDCAIITPIGPGHRQLFEESCAPSVETAIGFSKGPFDQVHHYVMDDREGGTAAPPAQRRDAPGAGGGDRLGFLPGCRRPDHA